MRLLLEKASRTTFENAMFSKQLARPLPGERWLLVTTTWHMPRAVGAFRKAGFSVLPWPIEKVAAHHHDIRKVAQHEYLGLIGYWLFGRTSELFPGPFDASLFLERNAPGR